MDLYLHKRDPLVKWSNQEILSNSIMNQETGSSNAISWEILSSLWRCCKSPSSFITMNQVDDGVARAEHYATSSESTYFWGWKHCWFFSFLLQDDEAVKRERRRRIAPTLWLLAYFHKKETGFPLLYDWEEKLFRFLLQHSKRQQDPRSASSAWSARSSWTGVW